jgi:hypothetical protein
MRPHPPLPYEAEPRAFEARETDCDAAYARYQASMDCFARFRNQNGSVKGDAYRFCTPVLDPSPRCGPPRNW